LVGTGSVRHESDIAGVVPVDGDFVNATVPEVVIRENIVEDEGDQPCEWG
jgi:hypothetical protein